MKGVRQISEKGIAFSLPFMVEWNSLILAVFVEIGQKHNSLHNTRSFS